MSDKQTWKEFHCSDGRFYRNELCFDGNDTLASKAIADYNARGLVLSDSEEALMKYWDDVLFEAVRTAEYKEPTVDADWRYGLWQIKEELNVKEPSGRTDKNGNPIMRIKYPDLNSRIKTLEDKLKLYYAESLIQI